jgi:hypothetical protein
LADRDSGGGGVKKITVLFASGLMSWSGALFASGVPLPPPNPERALLNCQNSVTADVLTPRQMVDRAIARNPCPEQSRVDPGKHCEKFAAEVKEAGDAWLREHKRSCDLYERFADIKINGCGSSVSPRDCQLRAQRMTEESISFARAESAAIDEFQKRLAELREKLIQIAEGAVHLQNETTIAPPESRPGSVDFFQRGYQNARQAMQYFNGQSLESASGILRAIRGSDGRPSRVTPEHVTGARYDLLQEPLMHASITDDFSEQLAGRKQTLGDRGLELGRQATAAQSNAVNLGNVSLQQMGQAAAALPAAAALAAGARPSASAVSERGTSNDTAMVWQRNEGEEGGYVQQSVPRTSLVANAFDSDAGVSAFGQKRKSDQVAPSLNSASVGALVANQKSAADRKGAASRSLRMDSSRAPASTGNGHEQGVFEGSPEAITRSGAQSPVKMSAVGKSALGGPLDPLSMTDSLGTDLSDSSFSMKGSETDSLVKQMADSFSNEGRESDHGRQQASKPEVIPGEDSAGLFQRTSSAIMNAVKTGRLTSVTPN